MEGYKWEPWWISIPLPENSIEGGKEADGSIVYVARSLYAGIKLPAKAIPGKRACYVPFDGLEIRVEGFEVLTGDAACFSWEQSSHGKLVPNALATDKMEDEKVYIGRAALFGSLTIGRIQPSHRCLQIPYDGKQHRIEHYEVLVYRKKPQMENLIDLGQENRVNASPRHRHVVNALISFHPPASRLEWAHTTSRSTIPPTAIFGGRDSNFSTLFIGRCFVEGHLLPCRVLSTRQVACATLKGFEIEKQSFEILIGSYSKWLTASNGDIPPNAFPGGYTKQGELLYVGRANYKGGLIVGRIQRSHRCIYVGGANGREYSFGNYEVLIED